MHVVDRTQVVGTCTVDVFKWRAWARRGGICNGAHDTACDVACQPCRRGYGRVVHACFTVVGACPGQCVVGCTRVAYVWRLQRIAVVPQQCDGEAVWHKPTCQ